MKKIMIALVVLILIGLSACESMSEAYDTYISAAEKTRDYANLEFHIERKIETTDKKNVVHRDEYDELVRRVKDGDQIRAVRKSTSGDRVMYYKNGVLYESGKLGDKEDEIIQKYKTKLKEGVFEKYGIRIAEGVKFDQDCIERGRIINGEDTVIKCSIKDEKMDELLKNDICYVDSIFPATVGRTTGEMKITAVIDGADGYIKRQKWKGYIVGFEGPTERVDFSIKIDVKTANDDTAIKFPIFEKYEWQK